MISSGDNADATRATLQAANPNWRIWRARRHTGEPGDWCATRDRVLTDDEMHYGLAHTLIEDTSDELAEALTAQRTVERVRRRELAARNHAYL